MDEFGVVGLGRIGAGLAHQGLELGDVLRMTADAVRDLEDIVDRISRHDGPEWAQQGQTRISRCPSFPRRREPCSEKQTGPRLRGGDDAHAHEARARGSMLAPWKNS